MSVLAALKNLYYNMPFIFLRLVTWLVHKKGILKSNITSIMLLNIKVSPKSMSNLNKNSVH